MSRSFVMGSLAGLALGLVSFASVSLMSPLKERPERLAQTTEAKAPEVAQKTAPAPTATPTPASASPAKAPDSVAAPDATVALAPAGSEFSRPKTDDAAAVPKVEPAPAVSPTPAVAAPAAEPAPVLAEPAPAAQPEGGQTAPTQSVAAPETPATGGGVASTAAPDAPAPATMAPSLPAPAIAGAEAAPDTASRPLAQVSGAGQSGGAPANAPAPAVVAPEKNGGTEVAVAEPAPAQPAAAEPAPADTITVPATAPAPEAGAPAPEGAGGTAPKVVDLTPRGAPAPDAAGNDASANGGASGDTGAAAPVPGLPEVIRPQPGLTRAVPGVKVNRLPTIGSVATLEPGGGKLPQTGPATAPDAAAPKSQALQLYAAKFQNPENKPVLAILLLDIGVAAGGLDSAALSGLPIAVTIAIDPSRKDAAAAAAAYRAAGSEVAILAGDLPAGATPSDLEVAYQSYVKTLPEAVALTGLPSADFQRNSQTAEHLAALLAVDGRGLIGYEQGLNPAERAAEKAHIGHASVVRLFTQADDNSGTLGRELDRAAFLAGQKGAVVIALPTTPEAVTGLVSWASGPSATGVVVAPVSAVMGNGG